MQITAAMSRSAQRCTEWTESARNAQMRCYAGGAAGLKFAASVINTSIEIAPAAIFVHLRVR